jgi:WD40 repeat protein
MVPEHPAQRFGFYTTDLHGRFIKGDTWSHFFASGSRNGGVRLWDLRNIREQPTFVCWFHLSVSWIHLQFLKGLVFQQ